MLTNSERMILNGALLRIIEGTEIPEAARQVIEYGSRLPVASRSQLETSWKETRSGPSIKGVSPGHGEVEIKGQKETTEGEWTVGIRKERLGYFRIWREYEDCIRFHHFWKSSLTTRGPDEHDPPTYEIRFDPQTSELEHVARLEEVMLWTWTFRSITVSRIGIYLEPLYGNLVRTRIGTSTRIMTVG